METFIISFLILVAFFLCMGLGTMFNRPPVRGHCGGLDFHGKYGVAPNPDCCFEVDEKNSPGCGECKCIE